MSPSKSDVLRLGALGPLQQIEQLDLSAASMATPVDISAGRYCFFELKPHWRSISSACSPRGLHQAVDLRAVPRSEVDAGRGIPDGRARCLFTLTGGNVASLVDYRANRSECDQTISELGDRLADIWHVERPFLTEAGPENSPTLNSTAAKEVCSTIGPEGCF